MSSEVLRSACQLAFVVAREGAEANDPIDPPSAMRSLLYVEDLPRRALAAAQQVIEENSEFRHRVAMRADEGDVGRAGFLWLHRPTGWAQEFEVLAQDADDDWVALEDSEPDPMLEAVYKGLTAEPIEIVPAQPPEPEDTIADHAYADEAIADYASDHQVLADQGFAFDAPVVADAPMASVSPIGRSDNDRSPIDDHPPTPSAPAGDLFPTPSSASLGLAAVTNTEQADHLPETPDGFEMASAEPVVADDDAGFEADALESELASLRGLVARLANEREPDAPEPVDEVEEFDDEGDDDEEEILELASPPMAAAQDEDPDGLSADLDAAHHELYLTRADLTIARQEREEAQRLQSEALKRQVQLEKELATVRERKADLEGDLTSSQAKAISVEERFGRIEAQLAEVDREREVVRGQLETMTLERNQIRDERSALRAERDELKAKVDDVVETTGGADLVELVEDHRVTKGELESTSRELARLITQAEQNDEQIQTLTAETAALKSERIDLRSRLGENETALEVTTTQYEALKIDAERMASELGASRAERDGLQTQLGDLQVSLGEALDELVESRQRNDGDRRQLNELRVEHDVLLSRLSDVEQAEHEAKNRANQLALERDELLQGRDELLEERGQLRIELSSSATDREAAQARLADVEGQLPALETELQMERRQREELANRLLELDDLADRTQAERLSLVEERDGLSGRLEELETEREDAEQYRRERDELATELATARTAHDLELQTMAQRLDDAARAGDELDAARSQVEQRAGDLDDELAALRSKLADIEAERDEALASQAEGERIRAELEERETELQGVHAALETARQDLDEANVASQVKESELRTVLGARTADAAEIERLKTNLADSMVRADSEVEDQAKALAEREAEVAARDGELASLRTELEAVRSVMADAEDESMAEMASVRAELAQATESTEQLQTQLVEATESTEQMRAELVEATESTEQMRAELVEATASSEQLQAELAEVRLELASTAAELEARGSGTGLGVMAPSVDGFDLPDPEVSLETDDDLDSAAAEVRSALRGPSVLDTIADGTAASDTADVEAEPEPLVDVDEHAEGDLALADEEVMGADADVDGVDLESDAGDDTGEHTPLDVGTPADLASLVDVGDPADSSVIDEVAAVEITPVDVPVEATGDDDELDEVSELIARTMSTFSPDDLTTLGPPSDENIDLAGEMTTAPADEQMIDTDETIGVSSTPPSILGDAPESFGAPERPDLGVSRSGGPKRRRIEVPADIIDDEVAAARFVVSSPDVVLLVDGDSVAQMGWPKLPVAQQRDALVTYLADLSANTGAAPDVVFDGRIGDGDSLPASRAVRIRLSTPPTPPTAALDELVDAYPEQWPIALVTDNTELGGTASDRGAAVLNNGQLLDLFIAE